MEESGEEVKESGREDSSRERRERVVEERGSQWRREHERGGRSYLCCECDEKVLCLWMEVALAYDEDNIGGNNHDYGLSSSSNSERIK